MSKMNEESNQKISQFVDGDLGRNEAICLLQEMRDKPELVDTFNRYQAISHALKNDVFLEVSRDFSTNISQQIEAEPTVLAPSSSSNFFMRYQKPCTLAASIAMIAVLVNGRGQDITHKATSQLSFNSAQTEQAAALTLSDKADQQQAVNLRIQQYLQAHNSSIYSHDETELYRLNQVAYINKK